MLLSRKYHFFCYHNPESLLLFRRLLIPNGNKTLRGVYRAKTTGDPIFVVSTSTLIRQFLAQNQLILPMNARPLLQKLYKADFLPLSITVRIRYTIMEYRFDVVLLQ